MVFIPKLTESPDAIVLAESRDPKNKTFPPVMASHIAICVTVPLHETFVHVMDNALLVVVPPVPLLTEELSAFVVDQLEEFEAIDCRV